MDNVGAGNTPPQMFYGQGAFNLDLSVAKLFRITESKVFEIRAESFNTLNHFNPNNPNTTLTYNFNTDAQNNASFGTTQGAQVQARRMILSARF